MIERVGVAHTFVIWCQDGPRRFGEVLCRARGGWLPVGFPIGRLPSWLHIFVTQRTAPETLSILMLDFWVEPLRADMPWSWFPRLNSAPEPGGILHPKPQLSWPGILRLWWGVSQQEDPTLLAKSRPGRHSSIPFILLFGTNIFWTFDNRLLVFMFWITRLFHPLSASKDWSTSFLNKF